jgi:hypothetical protein
MHNQLTFRYRQGTYTSPTGRAGRRLHALGLPGSGSHCVIAAYLSKLTSAAKSYEGRPTLASVTAGVSAAGYWDARSSASGWARR